MVSKRRKKDKTIVIRVSEYQKAQFEYLAKRCGLSLSDLIINLMYNFTSRYCDYLSFPSEEIDDKNFSLILSDNEEFELYVNSSYDEYSNRIDEFIANKK